jgi:hypothetical protein
MSVLVFLFDLIVGLLGFPISIAEDLANRNERGRFKRDSDKYVTR